MSSTAISSASVDGEKHTRGAVDKFWLGCAVDGRSSPIGARSGGGHILSDRFPFGTFFPHEPKLACIIRGAWNRLGYIVFRQKGAMKRLVTHI